MAGETEAQEKAPIISPIRTADDESAVDGARLLENVLAQYELDSTDGESGGGGGSGLPVPRDGATPPVDAPTSSNDRGQAEFFRSSLADDGVVMVNIGGGPIVAGTLIKRDVRDQKYVSTGNEKVEDIARKHLGPGASADEVAKHVLEIVILNENVVTSDDDFRTKKGDQIRLPGHTNDGAITFREARGTNISITPDGAVTFKHIDGTGHTAQSINEDSYSKKYFGPRPQDNYTVIVGKDGRVLSNDRVDPNHRKAEDLDTERTRLNNAADAKVGLVKEREQLRADMKQFEERAAKQGLSGQEVAQTYAEVSRLLELKGNKPLSDRERVRMALGIIRGAAEPTANDQGDYSTCQTTSVENRLYTIEPSAVARALADVATSGKFVAHDGTIVRPRPDDLRAHGQAALNAERNTWNRTYASQIYQITAINAYLTRDNEKTFPPKELRFEQGVHHSDANNGERLMDYSKLPPKYLGELPGAVGTANGIADTSYLMSGRWEPETVLSSRNFYKMTEDTSNKTRMITDASELQAALKQLHGENKFPLPLIVHANSDTLFGTRDPERVPFALSPSARNYLADAHVVNIIGYDAATGKIQLDNQWGKDGDFIDKPVTLEQVWNAMNRPTTMTWLDRLEADRPKMKPEVFAGHLKAVMEAGIYHWAIEQESHGVSPNEADMTRSRERFNALTGTMDPKLAQPVRDHIDNAFALYERAREELRKEQELQRREQ